MFQSKPTAAAAIDQRDLPSIGPPNGYADPAAGTGYEMSPFIAKSDSAELGFDNESLELARDEPKSEPIEEAQINNTFIEVNGDFCYMHQNPNKALKVRRVAGSVLVTDFRIALKQYI